LSLFSSTQDNFGQVSNFDVDPGSQNGFGMENNRPIRQNEQKPRQIGEGTILSTESTSDLGELDTIRGIGWLAAEDEDPAAAMRESVRHTWTQRREPSRYTPHDPDHFARVERWIVRLIPKDNWIRLSLLERKLLTWCAWTHDVGMLRSVGRPDASDVEKREQHVEESADWVADEYPHLRLSKLEAQAVAYINLHHSRKYNLGKCQEKQLCNGQTIRPKLLAAYLRLADALDVAYTRTDQPEKFELLVEQISQDTDNTLFHWIKSLAVADISVNHSRQEIEVEFFNLNEPVGRAPGAGVGKSNALDGRSETAFRFIQQFVINEIEDEIASVGKTLAFGGISAFHFVTSSGRASIRGNLRNQLQESMEKIISYIQIARSPSSTEVTQAALTATTELLERTRAIKSSGNQQEAWTFFRNALMKLDESLTSQLHQRRCHVELHRIQSEIQQRKNEVADRPQYEERCVQSLEDFVQRYKRVVGPLTRKSVEQFTLFLRESRRNTPDDAVWTFLLYGCSETVAKALAQFEQHHKLRLAIAEGRPKSQHGAHNKPVYIDAEHYLATLRNCGVKTRDIFFIPDACVATAIHRGAEAPSPDVAPIDAVLFGANGIYLDDEVSIVHSAGHLGVAIAASEHQVPVIVFASTAKIAAKTLASSDNPERKGDNWLTSDPDTRQRLKESPLNLGGTWNPREDLVPGKYIAAIVTEHGTVALKKSVSALAILRRWYQDVDRALSSNERIGRIPSIRIASPSRPHVKQKRRSA
jgi:translation initiation factor 2B subunit (eIF-2B alpha/beta/delta family)